MLLFVDSSAFQARLRFPLAAASTFRVRRWVFDVFSRCKLGSELILFVAEPYTPSPRCRCRTVMKSSRLRTNGGDTSRWCLPRKTGSHPTTAAMPQIIRARRQARPHYPRWHQTNSVGRYIAFRTRTVLSLLPHSTQVESLTFSTRGIDPKSIATARLLTTLIAATPGSRTIWSSAGSRAFT